MIARQHILKGIGGFSRRAVAATYSALLDFIYPPECLLCGQEIIPGESSFCPECTQSIRPRFRDICPRCGGPVGPFTDTSTGCGQCRRESFAFDRVIRLGLYENQMRVACLRAKAAGGSSVARALAQTLVQVMQSDFDELPIDLAVPIPEHWTRRFLHSYYAAEVLTQEIAKQLVIPFNRKVLKKIRRTPKQATSTTVRRRQQQAGSFGVSPRYDLRGKSILIVDDILTTGSTAHAAAKALKQAGASRIVVAVIAVSPLRQ